MGRKSPRGRGFAWEEAAAGREEVTARSASPQAVREVTDLQGLISLILKMGKKGKEMAGARAEPAGEEVAEARSKLCWGGSRRRKPGTG